jgi:hypothetical protein
MKDTLQINSLFILSFIDFKLYNNDDDNNKILFSQKIKDLLFRISSLKTKHD